MSLATRYRDDQVLFQNLEIEAVEAENIQKTFPNSNSISVNFLGFEFCVFLKAQKNQTPLFHLRVVGKSGFALRLKEKSKWKLKTIQ